MRRSIGATLLLATMILTGCGYDTFFEAIRLGDDDVVDVAPERYTEKVYVIGDLTGALADELTDQVALQMHDGEDSDAPIFVAGDSLATLTDAQITAIRAIYAAKHPVLLTHADRDQIVDLLNMLQIDRDFTLPYGIDRAEIFSVDLEDDGDAFEWVQYGPSLDEQAGDVDDIDEQVARANMLVQWLRDNAQRMDDIDIQQAKTRAARDAGNSSELTQLAAAFVRKDNFTDSGNNYQVTHYIWGCHSYDTDDDWFFVQQQCVFNGSGAYKGRTTRHSGQWHDLVAGYMDKIELDATVDGYEQYTDDVGMMQSTPATVNGVATLTSGISWNIGGKVGVNKTGPSAEISGGVTVSSSRTVSVSDCRVVNMSNDRGNNARWIYQFNRCDSVSDFLYAEITNPPSLSVSSFQPLNQWVWQTKPQVRTKNARMSVKLKVDLVSTAGAVDFLWKTHPVHTTTSKNWQFLVTMPYPKLTD